MKKFLALFACLAILLFVPSLSRAQDVSGMTGQVTDTTGAALPDTTIILTNKASGLKFTQKTGGNGSYTFSNVPPGAGYEAIFSHAGFAAVDVKNIYLTVATTRTQDAKLSAGADVQVEVTASNSEVTIQTTDATIGNTFDVKLLNDLPVQQRNYPTALFTLQPGVTDTGSVTGARVDQNYITLDGLDVNDFATGSAVQGNQGVTTGFNGSIVGHAPIDSVEEFRGTVGGFPPSSGLGSGGQFQLVTKSGTNQWHGNINEYHRDPSLVANSWFSDNANPIIPKNHLIQNQFGGNIGGPVLRDKLYFFFDYNNSRIISSQLAQRVVPLDSLRNGVIQYLNSSGGLGQLTPAQVQALDPAGIGEDANFLALANSRFPHANQLSQGDQINSGGYDFNAPNNDYETNYVGRVDYNITSKQKGYARFTIARENATNQLNAFSGDPSTDPIVDRSYAFVLGHEWQIGSNKFNQLFLGETVQKLSFPNNYNPDGSTFFTFGDGTQAALASSFYLNPNSQSRRIPIGQIGDNFTLTKGSHTVQAGGRFEAIRAKNISVLDYNTVEEGLGGHLFALCGPTPGACNSAVPTENLRPLDINQSAAQGNTAVSTYDQAFAFAIGRIGDIQSDFNYNTSGTVLPQLTGDQRIYQNYQSELYLADTWKITPNLTLSYGLNYQLFSVPYETRGLESTETTTFNDYMTERIAQSNASMTGPNAVPLISYILGGKANNGPPIFQPQHKLFAPRFAFAYNPGFDKKTVFNGSAALVYDRTVVNAIEQIQDADSYLFQQTEATAEGNPGDPYQSIKTDPRLDSMNGISTVTIVPPATPKAPYQPFVANGLPFGLQSGGAFNATIDPALKTPYSIVYNAGMQTSMRGDLVLKLNYAGRLGRRLLAQADANQVLDFPDPTSGQLYSVALGNVTQQLRAGVSPNNLTPQPWFENIVGPGLGTAPGQATATLANSGLGPFMQRGDIGDFTQGISSVVPYNIGSAAQFSENSFYTSKGFSSYNALLLSLQKNLSHGLQFDFNYTFAHSIDNVSFFANSSGDTGIGGVGLICDDVRPRECRANSDYDITNYLTADTTYQLPFGRHRTFFSNAPVWVNEAIGGWDLSGITDWHTGQAWGTNSNAFDASYSNDAPGILIGPKSAVATHLQKIPGGGVNIFGNQAAAIAAYTGPVGFTIGARNSLRGPKYFDQDLGLAKVFPLYQERVNLRFRADAFNALNHPNFGLPQSNSYNGYDQQDVTSTTFGQISSTVIPAGNLNNGARVLQVSLRLEF